MPKSRCRKCGKVVETFESIRYKDLTGWCSRDCWLAESRVEREKERELKRADEMKNFGRVVSEELK